MKNTAKFGTLTQGLGVLLLLLVCFASVLIIAFAPETVTTAYIIMILAMDVGILLGFLYRPSLATIVCGVISCVWVSYKLYMYYAQGVVLIITDYFMIPLPMLGALSAALFQNSLRQINSENSILRQQVEDLVLVDEATGLYNLRALYRDLPMMIRYGERNHLAICLMILQPRYEQELRGMLSYRQYTELRQRMATLVQDNVRIEDRVYSLNDSGMLGIVLTTDEKDSSYVRARLLNAFATTKVFEGILEQNVHLNLRIACKEYNKEYGNDMMHYKQVVESELAYDV
ncbi:MAG: hypothetical protein PHI98_09820 [Eubacteriales bacterium]|nr:hypothetical protein [Eubacteriales bacterium]